MFTLRQVSAGVLTSVTVRINPGVTALVGPSGCGKSTLFRILTKTLLPSSGNVEFSGTDLAAWDAVQLRRQVLMLPQESYTWPASVRENLEAGLRAQGRELPTAEQMQIALQVVGLDKALDADASQLSGGEKDRLAMGRSLLAQQAWALWDEPTAALDRAAAREVMERAIAYLRERDLNLVFITHDEALLELVDHQLQLATGQVVGDE